MSTQGGPPTSMTSLGSRGELPPTSADLIGRTAATNDSVHVSTDSAERLEAIEEVLGRHDREIQRSSRTMASLRRRIAAHELLATTPPNASPTPATEDAASGADVRHALDQLHLDAVAHAAAVFDRLSEQLNAAERERAQLVEIIGTFTARPRHCSGRGDGASATVSDACLHPASDAAVTSWPRHGCSV